MKRSLLLAAFAFFCALSALAVPVTFQVDLGPRINTGEFDPGTDKIEVRGSFNDWSSGFALTRTNEESTVYTGTRDISGTAGGTVEFKFVQVRDGTDTWETTPNRPFSLPETATVLPLLYFNNVWEGNPLPVKFQVNMATQKAAGAFDPDAGDIVEVRGSFNNWSGGLMLNPTETNANVFEVVADVGQAPGSQVEYKFVISRSSGQVIWENDPNRSFTQLSETQDLPVVYFNNITGVPVKAAITFQVDMSVQIAAGLFETNSQELYIRGNKVGWGNPPEGLQLFPDAARPGIYTNVLQSDSQITGDRIEYKATIWTPDTQATTWEDGANKALVFSGTEPTNAAGYHEIVVAPDFFNGIQPGDLLNEETTVTFQVDMRNARTTGAIPFNPQVDTVALNGSFFPGGWQTWGGLPDTQMFDDGASGGDAVAGDGVYSVQVVLPRGTSARLEYKYGINAEDNEAAQGNNHVRYVRASGSYTMPVDLFGTMTQESATTDLGSLAIERNAADKLIVTWNGQPGVLLQRLSSINGSGMEVAGTEGQSSYEVPTTESMAFYRLIRR